LARQSLYCPAVAERAYVDQTSQHLTLVRFNFQGSPPSLPTSRLNTLSTEFVAVHFDKHLELADLTPADYGSNIARCRSRVPRHWRVFLSLYRHFIISAYKSSRYHHWAAGWAL